MYSQTFSSPSLTLLRFDFEAHLRDTGALTEAEQRTALLYANDPAWRAALTILTHPRIWRLVRRHVDLQQAEVDFNALLEDSRTHSRGERILVHAALSLLDADVSVNLGAAMYALDQEWADVLVAGMMAYQGRLAMRPMVSKMADL